MPRVTRIPLRAPRDVAARPSRLKLLLRRRKRLVRPALWGLTGFGGVLGAIMVLHSAQPGGMVARTRAAVAGVADFRVQTMIVDGRNNTPEPMLNAALGVRTGDPILGFSLEAARRRVEGLSWVEHASIERQLPGTLVVRLTERRPFAIWQNQGKFVLVGRDGQVVTNEQVASFRDLPLVVGSGAPQSAAMLLDALSSQPALKARLVAAVRVGERRWNLRLKNGVDVLLPEGAEAVAMARLMELQSTQALLDRPLAVIDMRLPDRLVVRPTAATAAAPAPGKKA